MEVRPERNQLTGEDRRLTTSVRVPLLEEGNRQLLDHPRFTLGGHEVHPQMPRLHSEVPVASGQSDDLDRRRTVLAGSTVGLDQPEALEVHEQRRVDATQPTQLVGPDPGVVRNGFRRTSPHVRPRRGRGLPGASLRRR